jgi:hypothetical protein
MQGADDKAIRPDIAEMAGNSNGCLLTNGMVRPT